MQYLHPPKSQDDFVFSKPLVVGVTGGSCSGKTQLCVKIRDALLKQDQSLKVFIVSQNQFYFPELKEYSERDSVNYDHPDSFDHDKLAQALKDMKQGKQVTIRRSSSAPFTETQEIEDECVKDADVVFVKGIMTWYSPDVRELMDMKVFVDIDSDVMLSQRVTRDFRQDRDLRDILTYYLEYAKTGYQDFTLPLKKYADVIVPRGAENTVAIDLMVKFVSTSLRSPVSQSKKIVSIKPAVLEATVEYDE
eukprot:m.95542 g.95542  ORF g.95542 m.95542 type:complete len:249 (+) comp13059_c0_seq1:2277-3023(+)